MIYRTSLLAGKGPRIRQRLASYRAGAWSALLILAVAGVGRAQAPGAYQVDPRASRIEIDVYRGGVLGGLGDNHVVLIGDFGGAAVASPQGQWQVNVRARAASLTIADKGISDSTRREIQDTMLGPSQLDVAHFPTIELRTRQVVPGATRDSWLLKTEVTLHGVKREVDFPVAWAQNGDTLQVKGRATLRLRDFNIEPISKGLGAVKVKNQFDVVYSIALHRVNGPESSGR